MSFANTPYDDVFRTMLNDCTSLIIPLVNEVFGEQYTGNEQIIFSPNEHFLNRQDGKEEERISDTSFKIVPGAESKKYHWECQSSTDSSMLVRFFEYDTQIALDESEMKENILTVTLPNSAALFLRCNNSTPDRMKIEIVTPDGMIGYTIPVMKLQQYALEEIFEKRLLFLIPFYIFSHESRFKKYNESKKELMKLQKEYRYITVKLEELLDAKIISEYTKCTLLDMSNKVLEHIARNYQNVREGVKAVMGGKILDYEAKKIKNEGIILGKAEGIIETGLDFGLTENDILDRLQNKLNISLQTAKEYLLKYNRMEC